MFKTDFNGTRVSTVYNLIRSCLRIKETTRVCCELFDMPVFWTEDQWKTATRMETVLHSTSKLATDYKNENDLNACCRTSIRKIIHHGISNCALNVIYADS